MELERGDDNTSNTDVGKMTTTSKLAVNVIMDGFYTVDQAAASTGGMVTEVGPGFRVPEHVANVRDNTGFLIVEDPEEEIYLI